MTHNFHHLFAGLGLALVATTSLAMPPMEMHPDGNPPPRPMLGRSHEPMQPFLRDIALTEEQRDKVFEIMHAHAPNLRAREKELQQAREGLIKLTLTAEFDEVKAKVLTDSSARIMAEIELTRARIDHQLYRLLTPEQRKQVGNGQPHGNEHCGDPRMK